MRNFTNICFDIKNNSFSILEGSVGTYVFKDIVKCEIVYEDDKHKGKYPMFSKPIIVGGLQIASWSAAMVWCGLRITMKEDTKLYVYLSKEASQWQSLQYHADTREGREIIQYAYKHLGKYDKKKEEKKSVEEFESILIDKEERTFTILEGSIGTYALEEIAKCSVLGEVAKYKGKGKPFTHSVLTGVGIVSTPLFEPAFYVGIKIEMKNGEVLAVYVSKEKTRMNTDLYFKDKEKAEKIEKILMREANILESKKTKDIKKIQKQNEKFTVLHKDTKQYWGGKLLFLVLVIAGMLFINHYKINLKEIFPNLGGKETTKQIITEAYDKLDTLDSYKIVDKITGQVISIENEKEDSYKASVCEESICKYNLYKEEDVFTSSDATNYAVLTPKIEIIENSIHVLNMEDFFGKEIVELALFDEIPAFIKVFIPKDNIVYEMADTIPFAINENLKEDKTTEGTSIYTMESFYNSADFGENKYSVEYHIDRNGYLTYAKMKFENEEYQKYNKEYEFKIE